MRWLVTVLVVSAALSGCTLLQPTSSGAGAAGDPDAGGGPSVCHTTTSCADCTNCALNGPCAMQLAACEANSDCQAIDQCESTCGLDATCKQSCMDNNPNGASDYTALTNCVDCNECANQCAGLCG